jgi:hypothetical protein
MARLEQQTRAVVVAVAGLPPLTKLAAVVAPVLL